MHTIKEIADEVGVSATTLRAWERRYEVVEPRRSQGGYRLYSPRDARVLALMASLVRQGRPPRLAATEARDRVLGEPAPTADAADASDAASPMPLDEHLVEALLQAAAAMDAPAVTAHVETLLSLGPLAAVVDRQLMPAMAELGERWARGQVSVAGEHLAANTVMRALASEYARDRDAGHGPRVLIGLPPGARHEIGLLAFAALARGAGLRTEYLGADLPVEEWAQVVRAPDVGAIVLALPTAAEATTAAAVFAACREASPDLVVAVGGSHQHRAPDGVLRLGHELGPAARTLAAALAPA